MKIAILHDAPGVDALPDDLDVLAQIEAVNTALGALGHDCICIPCTLNLEDLARTLAKARVDGVFNLVESLGGYGRLLHLPPALLETIGIPYAGSRAGAIWTTSNKPLAKQLMAAAQLPTALWVTAESPASAEIPAIHSLPERMIIKSVWEHASRGLDDRSVLRPRSLAHIISELHSREADLGGEAFAEAYIEGREFNIAMLASAPESQRPPQILPAAEIRFENFEPGRPRILGYSAKWETSSSDYTNTDRSFDIAAVDAPLVRQMERLARRAWELFSLRGWARVDFRVDESGQPWILEVNANPCLSPDAGFAAALQQAGIPFALAIARILADGIPSPSLKTTSIHSPHLAAAPT